jgi:hypothetical protein
MRRQWAKLGRLGGQVMDRFEERLRREASLAQETTRQWLAGGAEGYDLVIDGGDVAMPLARHEDRITAARTVWSEHLERTGEPDFIALTGNHELGHGFDADPESYADLLVLRRELFGETVNRRGYGLKLLDGCQLLFLDSELIAMARQRPDNPWLQELLQAQVDLLQQVNSNRDPVVLFTHNSTRVVRWIKRSLNLWQPFVERRHHPIIVGGHFHMPRSVMHMGAEIRWCAGGSYPEPWLRWAAGVPRTGIRAYWPGGVEIAIRDGRPLARQRNFDDEVQGPAERRPTFLGARARFTNRAARS